MSDIWDNYIISLTVDRLVAGIPSHDKPLQAWLDTNKAPAEAVADQVAMVAALPDEAQMHSVVFYRDGKGNPCYESRCLKAALKEAANVTKVIAKRKNYRARLAERVFVGPPLVPITTKIESGERPISVMTMQGPRTSLKRFEYAEQVPMSFNIRVLKDPEFAFTVEDLELLLEYAQEGGIGSDRSQGAGTFTLHSCEPVAKKELTGKKTKTKTDNS